jgi:hypothetical protein
VINIASVDDEDTYFEGKNSVIAIIKIIKIVPKFMM